MGQAVSPLARVQERRLEVIPGGLTGAAQLGESPSESSSLTSSQSILLWAWIVALLQVTDGVMTALGVKHYGHSAEANLLLRSCMEIFGAIPTLVFAKSLALVVIYFLVQCAQHVPWVPRAMRAIAALYLFLAVIPWSYILIRHYFV